MIRRARRLEGWDDEWHETSAQRRSATFTNLPAGRYTFRVKAANRDGLWSDREASIALTVLPPTWKTWWAYAVYALAAIGWIAGFVSLRTGALRRRERQLQALVDERTPELLESERRATEANQAKSVFLANMSHELRTPLNAVLGFARLLDRNPALGKDDRSGLEIIRKAGEHLLGLINDVLSLSKIEAGRLTLDPKPFGLRSLLRSVDSIIRVRADQAGLRLELAVDGELPEVVVGDEGKLRQVLVNLLSNAVKFTPPADAAHEGRVTLRASWREGRAYFEVRDTGLGIAPGELGSLFQPFVQTETGRKSREGTGLGLVITRDIVRLMSGDVAVTSQVGEGTSFSFDVALPAADAAIEREEESRVVGLAPGERPRRVLVVDDTPENRLLLRRLLTDVGLEVVEASDGREGVERWERDRPDLVLMDLRMPVLDGRDATRRIREREALRRDGSRTPIVAVTASTFEHERDAVLACGADDFLMKPFREPQLFRIVEERTGVKLRREGAGGEEGGATRLTAERLAGLTAAERARLREALERGDFDLAASVAEEIARRDDPLGQLLLAEVREFRLDGILALLGKE